MPNEYVREDRFTRLAHLKIVRHGWFGRIHHSPWFHKLVDRLSAGEV